MGKKKTPKPEKPKGPTPEQLRQEKLKREEASRAERVSATLNENTSMIRKRNNRQDLFTSPLAPYNPGAGISIRGK